MGSYINSKSVSSRDRWALANLTSGALKAMLLALLVYALFWRDSIFAITVGACLVLSLVPNLLGRHIWLPLGFDLCCTALLLSHVLFGMTLGLYATSSFYDKVVHFVGVGLLSWQALKVLDRECVTRKLLLSCRVVVVLVLGFALALGAAWEIFEFMIDRTGFVVSQPSLSDTMNDLIADAIGGSIPFILRFYFRSRRMLTT